MKRSTCKLLVYLGILWLLIVTLLVTLILFVWVRESDSGFIMHLSFFTLYSVIFNIPAWILFIVAIAKWNSENEFINLKQRAKVNLKVKGDFKDLK